MKNVKFLLVTFIIFLMSFTWFIFSECIDSEKELKTKYEDIEHNKHNISISQLVLEAYQQGNQSEVVKLKGENETYKVMYWNGIPEYIFEKPKVYPSPGWSSAGSEVIYLKKIEVTNYIAHINQQLWGIYKEIEELQNIIKNCIDDETRKIEKQINESLKTNEVNRLFQEWYNLYYQWNFLEAIEYFIEYLNHYPNDEVTHNAIQLSYLDLWKKYIQEKKYNEWKNYILEAEQWIVDNYNSYKIIWIWYWELYSLFKEEKYYTKAIKNFKYAESAASTKIEKAEATKLLKSFEEIKAALEQAINKWDYEAILWNEKHSNILKLFSKISVSISKQNPQSQKRSYEELVKTLTTKQEKFSFEKKVISQMLIDWCNEKINLL